MLYTLIAAMVLVMVGLIIVQASLILRASTIKEEQFNRSAQNALDKVINQLETSEVRLASELAIYGRVLEQNNPLWKKNDIIQERISSELSISFGINEQNYFSRYRKELKFSYADTLIRPEYSVSEQTTNFNSPFDRMLDMNSRRQELAEIQLNESYLLQEKLQLQERPLKERVDSALLKQALDEAFRSADIGLDYKYAVFSFDEGEEEFITGSPDYDFHVKRYYDGVLFPSDINRLNANWIHVYFPKRTGFVLKDTGIMVIPLVILTGLLIAIFTYTILIIFRQKKLSMIKNDFINNMTHELKTPISTISLASQMLEDGTITNTPKTIGHISKVINQESKRLSYQVEKVLQMAVFNEGRLKLRFKELNLNSLINNVVSNFELKVQNKNGELISQLNAEDAEIKGDEVHITNVVFNLLDNAIKYSNGTPRIVVSTKNKKDTVVVSVQDNGIGIPKEHISQIFERFYRVPTGNVHNVKGFGLGLSYVKKIADVHNTQVKVESTLNKGTKFSLYFPLINNQHGTKS